MQTQGAQNMASQPAANVTSRELSFGERMVGLNFNPSKFPEVDRIKAACAAALDAIHGTESFPGVEVTSKERKEMVDLAYARIMEGQMWAVKAATWGI